MAPGHAPPPPAGVRDPGVFEGAQRTPGVRCDSTNVTSPIERSPNAAWGHIAGGGALPSGAYSKVGVGGQSIRRWFQADSLCQMSGRRGGGLVRLGFSDSQVRRLGSESAPTCDYSDAESRGQNHS